MRLRALLIDDSPPDRIAVSRALERDPDPDMHWEVEWVDTAEAALDRLGLRRPDVMLMDYHLPGMDGLELLRTVRQRLGDDAPAVVMLTGSGNESVAVEAMKAGALDYIIKESLNPEWLRRSLKAAVATRSMNRELEARRVQTERAERSAREALSVRDELFALATHDLKGPLQIIALNAQMLRRQLFPDHLTDSQRDRLDAIVRATQRMGELVDHFLEVTRGQEQVLRRSEVDLLALVRAKVREQETAARHRFELRVEGADFLGSWDARALERVLENLLGNAVKYSTAGTTVTVTLGLQDLSGGRHVRLDVADQGIGIPAEDLPFVFERFRRGHNVDASVAGSGVGLASARRLVEMHGGTISVCSQEGRGATFTVVLPRRVDPVVDASAS